MGIPVMFDLIHVGHLNSSLQWYIKRCWGIKKLTQPSYGFGGLSINQCTRSFFSVVAKGQVTLSEGNIWLWSHTNVKFVLGWWRKLWIICFGTAHLLSSAGVY
jgi:hypothetical protein